MIMQPSIWRELKFLRWNNLIAKSPIIDFMITIALCKVLAIS